MFLASVSTYIVALAVVVDRQFADATAAPAGKRFLQQSRDRSNNVNDYATPSMAPEHWSSLVISLKQQNVAKLLDAAMNVSTPGHKDYGQFWSVPAIEQLTAPAEADVQYVTGWLKTINATFHVDNDLVLVTSNAEVAEETMPPAVRAHAAAIYSSNVPDGASGRMSKLLPREYHNGDTLAVNITPALVSDTYSTGSATVNRSSRNSQIAFSSGAFIIPKYLKTFFSEVPQSPLHRAGDADLFSFATGFGSRGPPSDFKCDGDDPMEWNCAGVQGEPSLDVQLLMGTAPGVRTGLFRLDVPVNESTYFVPTCPSLLGFVNYLLKDPDAPYSASISYGLPQLCAEEQITDLDIRFAKLALKGVSVMAASGDSGTQPVDGCNTSACMLQTLWPASSPWVTAVGGTVLSNGTSGVGNQAAWNCSGGGFSKQDRKIAPWQERAVSEYLAQLPSVSGHPPEGTFNAAGMGVPDVAAFAVYVETCVHFGTCSVGDATSATGTSYASPIFAGIASLLNEARLQANLPPMGFLNPFLYQNADAFTDIVDGSNRCVEKQELYGFPATKGWDAATGLGTPNFEKLRAAALAQFTSSGNANK